MLDSPRVCQLKDLHERQGLHASQLAKAGALDRRTVAYWLAQDHFRPRKPRPHARPRDPCKADMVRGLERHPSAAAQVFQRLGEHGFDGRSALGKASVRTVRPRRPPALLTLAFAPGACAQGDGGAFGAVPVGHTHRQLRVFGMGWCSSRMLDVACTVSQTLEPFLACHPPACDVFGGIPQQILVDPLTAAVLKRAGGEAPVRPPTYADGATPHGVTITPCHVGQGQEKGRVATGVGSVHKPGLTGLEIPDFRALHPAATPWLDTIATVRLPGETRPQPTLVWQTERPALRPVPLPPFARAPVSQVRASRQCRVTVATNRSAVPAQYAGHALTWQTSPDRRCLSRGAQRMARPTRRDDRHRASEAPDHPKPRRAQRKKARDHPVFGRFLALAPQAEA